LRSLSQGEGNELYSPFVSGEVDRVLSVVEVIVCTTFTGAAATLLTAFLTVFFAAAVTNLFDLPLTPAFLAA
jgi:hypothetical protein